MMKSVDLRFQMIEELRGVVESYVPDQAPALDVQLTMVAALSHAISNVIFGMPPEQWENEILEIDEYLRAQLTAQLER